jgi:DGQHR domain-containing protein
MATKSNWLSFDCFIFRQGLRGPEIAVFPIDAYALQNLSTISRIADEEKGYQRIINPRKLAAIRRYVETPEAVLPTGIVLATGDKPGLVRIIDRQPIGDTGQIWSAKLQVQENPKYKPFLVIDGQHRLFGITSSKLTPYPMPVTVLLEASSLVQMAHFEIINNKATRIPTAHLNELRGMMFNLSSADEEKLKSLLGQLGVTSLDSSALVSELNGPNLIFEGILDFPSNKAGFVSSNTLRQLIDRSRESGFLNYLPEDDDADLRAYNALWQGISRKFSRRWKQEVGLFQKYADGGAKKAEVKAQQKLLHSGSLFVLGHIADNELASSSFRKKWLEEEPKVISDLVQKEIFGTIPEGVWDSDELEIDNTSKGRRALRKFLEEQMV